MRGGTNDDHRRHAVFDGGGYQNDSRGIVVLRPLEARAPNWEPAFVILSFRAGRLLWPELVTRHDDGVVEFRGEVIHV